MVDKRSIGDSGIEVAPLALGGNVFGWTADEGTSFAVLDAFVDAGGTMIDTADVYSAWVPGHTGGESEALIGRWLRRDPSKRDKVVIATKVGFLDGKIVDGEYVAALHPDVISRACDLSLERLGTDCIDLYYQHRDNPEVPLADSLGAFERLREEGKIRAVGISNFTADRVDEAVATARRLGLMPAVALQTWYNLVERERFEAELRDAALRNGLAVFPFYSIANGFLTGKYRSKDDLAKSPRGMRNVAYLEGKGQRVLGAMDEIAEETGAALATIALAWLIAQPAVTAPIASATSVEQLNQLTAAMHLRLSLDQIARLNAASAETVPA
ncbi:MAG TPA: aldo/keto reductase [Sphingomicrobium sp.]|nr:aldo/keto reductase [Sphingomicrobium sp.]